MRLILGSKSPRRAEILSYFSLPFEQHGSSFDESLISFKGDPRAHVEALAIAKAKELSPNFPKACILTADTVVYCQNTLYEKPKTEQEGFQTLMSLAGTMHSVFTGVALQRGADRWVKTQETRVCFHPLNAEQIKSYQRSLHCADKAGGYAIQRAGSIIVESIEGCYYNVMGLPVQALQHLLLKVGISLWDHLRE